MKTKNKVYFGIALFVVIGLVLTLSVPSLSQGLLKLKKPLLTTRTIPHADQPAIVNVPQEIDLNCEPLTLYISDEKHLKLGDLQNSADIHLLGVADDHARFTLNDLTAANQSYTLNENESFKVNSSPDNGFEYEFKLIHADTDFEFGPGINAVVEVKNLKVCKKTEVVIVKLVDALNPGDVLIYDEPFHPLFIQHIKNNSGTQSTGSTTVNKQIMLNDGLVAWRDFGGNGPNYIEVKDGDTWNLDLSLDQVNDYRIEFTRENVSGNLGLEIFEL